MLLGFSSIWMGITNTGDVFGEYQYASHAKELAFTLWASDEPEVITVENERQYQGVYMDLASHTWITTVKWKKFNVACERFVVDN